jgi:hypothetical protein
MKKLFFFLFFNSFLVSAQAVSMSMPRELILRGDGFVFAVKPPALSSIRDVRALELGDYAYLYAKYGVSISEIDYALGEFSYGGSVVWRRRLLNNVMPCYIELVKLKTGRAVMTLGDYFMRKDSPAAIVIYRHNGSVALMKSLRDIFSESELELIFKDNDVVDVFQDREILYNPIRLKIMVNGLIKIVNLKLDDTGQQVNRTRDEK